MQIEKNNHRKVLLRETVSIQKDHAKVKKPVGDTQRNGLSLFWLVILVILILWAVGFLSGGFGLGGLINLLLIIALILLILWLLRII